MSIYKECDIRGIYEKEFDAQTAYDIGRAVGTMKRGKTLAVGGDVRLSTPLLKKELIIGLRESGANVVDLGMVPTPVFYYALSHLEVDGGITVTASHNPPEYNGFKLMFGQTPITADVIGDIEHHVKTKYYSRGNGTFAQTDVLLDYEDSLLDTFTEGGRLKVVIDCGNGAMSELAPRLFEKLGYEVVRLYCEFDGSFPNRDPNPAVYEHLSDLCKTVLDHQADFGIAFDGDGDRVVFVDDQGQVVNSERSLVIFINEYLQYKPSSVVYDLKCSSIVKNAVLALGGTPLMERSGHAFIKKRFLDNHSVLAGEISGHFFFGELGYDDGLFAALEMATILDVSGEKLSAMVSRIPKPLITPDIRIFCPYAERESWLEKIRILCKDFEISEIDGVRVEFPNGWMLVRKSVTEEGMTIRIEANDEKAMQDIKTSLMRALPQLAKHPFFLPN